MPPSPQVPLPARHTDSPPRNVLPARVGDAGQRPKRLRHIHDASWSGRYMNCAACVEELEAETSAMTPRQYVPRH
jgi:hypothetical protein